jgi:excisionase family DNA binding protein
MTKPTTSLRVDPTRGDAQKRSGLNSTVTIPFAQRLTCTTREACEVTGLGRSNLYELIGRGALDTVTIGRRRLVQVTSLLSGKI